MSPPTIWSLPPLNRGELTCVARPSARGRRPPSSPPAPLAHPSSSQPALSSSPSSRALPPASQLGAIGPFSFLKAQRAAPPVARPLLLSPLRRTSPLSREARRGLGLRCSQAPLHLPSTDEARSTSLLSAAEVPARTATPDLPSASESCCPSLASSHASSPWPWC